VEERKRAGGEKEQNLSGKKKQKKKKKRGKTSRNHPVGDVHRHPASERDVKEGMGKEGMGGRDGRGGRAKDKGGEQGSKRMVGEKVGESLRGERRGAYWKEKRGKGGNRKRQA